MRAAPASTPTRRPPRTGWRGVIEARVPGRTARSRVRQGLLGSAGAWIEPPGQPSTSTP
jgi:hypothetical protein